MPQRVTDGVVLVTGASSGIGAAMAARFHARGARVFISGRDRARLESAAARHPGMSVVVMDVADPESVTRGMAEVAAGTPHLTTHINNAGVQRLLDFSAAEPPSPADVAPEIATNFTGLIHVTAAALPLLRRAPRARVVHVGSGLGFVPFAKTPVYSATKAAVHSFTISLRRQLAGSTVQVVEMIPPVVDTPLHRDLPSVPPMAMPWTTSSTGRCGAWTLVRTRFRSGSDGYRTSGRAWHRSACFRSSTAATDRSAAPMRALSQCPSVIPGVPAHRPRISEWARLEGVIADGDGQAASARERFRVSCSRLP